MPRSDNAVPLAPANTETVPGCEIVPPLVYEAVAVLAKDTLELPQAVTA